LVSRGWDVALGKPRCKLRVLSRASQSAFAVIVNASVDLWPAFNGGKHFENHSSALHARKAFVFTARPATDCPPVNPDETVKFIVAFEVLASLKVGTELHIAVPLFVNRTA
jgi:hypothetical protein